MKKLICVVLLLCGFAAAQCPVSLKIVSADYIPQSRHVFSTNYFLLKWVNVSSKEIVGAKFQATFIDPTHERHDVFETWSADVRLKPGKSKHSRWEDTEYMQYYSGKYAEIRLLKAMFVDGSTWEDDGSEPCVGKTPSVKW